MFDGLRFEIAYGRARLRQRLDRVGVWFGYHCPAWLRYWIANDACAKVWSAVGNRTPDEISIMDLMQHLDIHQKPGRG